MKHHFAPHAPALMLGKRSMTAPLSLTSAPLVLVERPKGGPSPSPRRAKIWELSRYLHCSVIGTCLSTAELRHILAKSGFITDGVCDHDLHGQGVTVAGQADVAGKLLHKALDRRHRQAISQFAKAKNAADLCNLWNEARARGDIPGAYWAALTHPDASDDLVRRMFGEVHMLSHLVGAANRADIRRLTELEAENANLREKLRRQEDHLREGISSRDASIRDLNQLLARRIADQEINTDTPSVSSELTTVTKLVADLELRLGAESRRRHALESRLARLTEGARRDREALGAAEARERALREELEALETSFLASSDRADAPATPKRFDGAAVLYVGGRPQQQSSLKALAAPRGIDMLFHDGGIEDRHGLLPGLVSRADVVMFPVDCVSHEAALAVKRLCGNAAKAFVPLRSSGVSSFLAALEHLSVAKALGERAVPATA